MKPPLFDYVAPTSLEAAVAALGGDAGAMILAGGQSLVPAMNMRLANPAKIVDIARIAGLDRIAIDGDAIIVGAMVRHRDLELDQRAHAANPIIRAALEYVAHVPIRNRGTVVGSLCHADAAAEMPMVLLLLDGNVTARGPRGERVITAEDFFDFHLTTTRKRDELIVTARFPALPKGAGWAFEEHCRRHGDYALAAVGAVLEPKSGEARLAACGIAAKPVRLTVAEDVLRAGGFAPEAIGAAAESARAAVTAADDIHGTQSYRRRLVAALTRRAIAKALERAGTR